LVKFSTPNGVVQTPVLEVFNGAVSVGQVSLNAPSSLPPTEANGSPYTATSYWATLDKAWVKPGLTVQVKNGDGQRSVASAINVGAATSFTMLSLPFYLFGVSESAAPFAQTTAPDVATRDEYFAKHPISDLQMVNHPAQKVTWPYIVVGPRQGRPAQKVLYKEQQGDGFAVMSAVLNVLSNMRKANADASMNNQYYAPLIMALQAGTYSSPGGGLGGGDVGTGDFSYTGIFIHEAGHAFGMPHANDGYVAGNYPYIGGSLKGSSWGYDQKRNELLSTLVPATASTYKNCLIGGFPLGRQVDSLNRCIKQDPMQSGSGDQASGSKYTMFSDFNASVVQNYLEGDTTLVNGKYVYSGGKIKLDSSSSTGFSRWNTVEKRYVPVETKTTDAGLYGLDNGLATQRNVAVHTLVLSASLKSIVESTGPAQLDYNDTVTYDTDLTQIYPPISYVGNLRRMIDPTDAVQLATIQPNTGLNYWYCKNAGCDYTLRVTFTDNSMQHTVLQSGFRGWFNNALSTAALDPLDSASFRTWAVNVPAAKAIKLIELLETPEVYKGLSANPRVIASRVVN
jgi:Peptidase M66